MGLRMGKHASAQEMVFHLSVASEKSCVYNQLLVDEVEANSRNSQPFALNVVCELR